MTQTFFQLLRCAMGIAEECPEGLTEAEWQEVYRLSKEQALLGVTFQLIQDDRHKTRPSRELLLKWLAISEQMRQRNMLLNKKCVELAKRLETDGFRCCILKGQGNAAMYPNPYARTPGDIDVWILGHTDSTDDTDIDVSQNRWSSESSVSLLKHCRVATEEDEIKARKAQNIRTVARKRRGAIIQYAKSIDPKAEVRYYHVEFDWDGVPVELHFMPGIMNNPMYNRRLQRWYESHTDNILVEGGMRSVEGEVGKIPVPTREFNIVFQLAHMMHHFFDEGIGLRQFVDYYYVLKGLAESAENAERYKAHTDDTDSYLTQKLTNTNLTNHTNSYRNSLEDTLRHLGLWKFAGAVMYVMREVFALEERYMITPVDERRGKTLLNEILKGGNFGQHSGLTNHSTGGKYFAKTWRNMKLVREYPAEALCEPVFRTWHFFWRLAHR